MTEVRRRRRRSHPLRRALRRLAPLAAVPPLTGLLLLVLAIDTSPALDRQVEVTAADLAHARAVLAQNDPRTMRPGERRTVAVSAMELDMAANCLARRLAGGSASIQVEEGRVHATASLRLPHVPIPLFLNLRGAIVESDPIVRLASLYVGDIPVAPDLANWAVPRALALLGPAIDLAVFTDTIRSVRVTQTGIAATYETTGLVQGLRTALVPPKERERLRDYQERLYTVSRLLDEGRVSLTDLLSPMFAFSADRPHEPAVAENRAALFVLAMYVNGRSLERVLPEARDWPVPIRHGALLARRDDFPKHFIISAAVAANAGGPLADAIGLYKEVDDSVHGTGFSFNDLAVDRAGTQFGQLAADEQTARRLQQRVGGGLTEGDILPPTQDLPEFMNQADFTRRFGGVEGDGYRQMMATIERRVSELPLYR